jgi:hypothetical protein
VVSSRDSTQEELDYWHDFIKEAQSSRELKLEPNAVPMLVINSLDHETFRLAAHAVAKRHSDDEGPFGDVPVKELFQGEIVDDVIREIDSWIDSIL